MEKQKFTKALGARIKTLRESKGISLRELESYDDSIDKSTLSKIENGHGNPTVYNLYRISKLLDIPLEEFVKDLK